MKKKSQESTLLTSSLWHKQMPFSMELGLPTPPGWYLYLVIIFQIITIIVDPLIYEGHPQAALLALIMRYVAYLWFGLNFAMIGLLFFYRAKGTAYILPAYYLVLFAILVSLGVVLSYTAIVQSTIRMVDIQYWLLIITTLIETSIALIQLRMRSDYARHEQLGMDATEQRPYPIAYEE